MGQLDKLKILPQNGLGRDSDILPWERLGWDFDRQSRSRPGISLGQKGKKSKKTTIFDKVFFDNF
jgi:hypothetical protein